MGNNNFLSKKQNKILLQSYFYNKVQKSLSIFCVMRGYEYNNYLGTIIGIHKFKLNTNPMSILLYFDQRTGKIERF